MSLNMEVRNAIKNRFSVRKFKNVPVEQEKLRLILNAARLAPSAVNFQPWHFIVIQKPENLDKIYKIYPREWIKSAAAVIIACSDPSRSWKRNSDGKNSADIDIAIAVDHIILQATELELGTCWVCNFNVNMCSELFEIPEHLEPVVLIPMGYPDIEPPVKKRKPMEEIVHWEKF
jgi:nitroreductase